MHQGYTFSGVLQTTYYYSIILTQFFVDSPHICGGRSTPPLPIAIQCLSTDEARTIQRTLHPLISSQPQQPTSSELLRILGSLRAVVNLLSSDLDGFYPVVVGTRVGIHCTRTEAAVTQGNFSYPRWRHTDTFWEVLAYMIIKGVEERMPPLNIPEDLPADSIGHGKDSLSLASDISLTYSAVSIDDSLTQTFERSVHINGTYSRKSRDPSLGFQMSTSPSDGTPIIYSHVRSHRSVIQSRYFSPVPRSTNSDLDTEPLGVMANCYLVAHSYIHSAISLIVDAYHNQHSAETFALRLSHYGLPISEGLFCGT
ncbi:hypothetical protein PAXRUDRAFT_157686 [Paxillus rubicundulus Ve08.2h10]|uniref:Uncharacterized protein n=1 Tax=Paxillus rubicundulus Ve08.2h10 TaxID=930991 RepID=A0A0D0DPE2_9AGAM|nr:hypothetical protein PAXRUDRAFT_157686 [Paxillus rubicundulus Ve08.2h10]